MKKGETSEFYKNCPKCNDTVYYSNKYTLQNSVRDNKVCKSCWPRPCNKKSTAITEFCKNCPDCNKVLYYSSKYHLKNSLKKNSCCLSCRSLGSKNPFFGKKHSKEVSEKIKISKKKRGYDHCRTPKFREEVSKRNKDNWMSKMSFYEKWIELHGIEIADIKMIELKKKHSLNSSGSKNSMYGKQTPKKAGNGWSGWYNGYFFRSLRELGYIYYELELKMIDWKSAENIRIPYVNYDGKDRTYSPDFLVGNKLIEIKPEKLIDSPLIKLKTEAALKYCKENSLEFEILDYQIIDIKDLDKLIDNGKVILTEKTKEKLLIWRNKNS